MTRNDNASVRDALCGALRRFQQEAMRDTGLRPVTFVRTGEEARLMISGCHRPGLSCWQPVEWQNNQPELGLLSQVFHRDIVEYVSTCQFLEIRFCLPVSSAVSKLSFLKDRLFETAPNTERSHPRRAFEEAAAFHALLPQWPLAYRMAVTCDGGVPISLMLNAEDGEAFLLVQDEKWQLLPLRTGLAGLLPKIKFVFPMEG